MVTHSHNTAIDTGAYRCMLTHSHNTRTVTTSHYTALDTRHRGAW